MVFDSEFETLIDSFLQGGDRSLQNCVDVVINAPTNDYYAKHILARFCVLYDQHPDRFDERGDLSQADSIEFTKWCKTEFYKLSEEDVANFIDSFNPLEKIKFAGKVC